MYLAWRIGASGMNAKMWSSDVVEPNAKTSVQAPYLSPGFSDFGDG